MDATTFMQMQQEAQAQIDALNAQITTLTQQKSDLVNTNNTSIIEAQNQAKQIISDANTQAQGIVATANANAQSVMDASNKSKSDADAYVANQQAFIDSQTTRLKQDQDTLASGQASLSQAQSDFESLKKLTIQSLEDIVTSAKDSLDLIIGKINA